MLFQELVPGSFTSVGARIESMFGQDPFDGIARD